MNGTIDPTVYYFFALDTDGISNEGPVAVTTTTGFGNGWGTLVPVNPNVPVQQPPFFVEIFNGTANMWRVQPVTTNGVTSQVAVSLGPPYRWGILGADRTPQLTGPIVYVEIDASLLVFPVPPATTAPPPPFVNVNWITVLGIPTQPQQIGSQTLYDDFGGGGNNFFQVPLGQSNTWISGVNNVPFQPQITTAGFPPNMNIIAWRIEDRLNQ